MALVITFWIQFDLPQMGAERCIDMVNENYYRKAMNPNARAYSGHGDESASASAQAPTRIPSGALLGERKEIVIVHNGREYRLRQTQNGKLILTA
jgi:hemin uptake protein HemP